MNLLELYFSFQLKILLLYLYLQKEKTDDEITVSYQPISEIMFFRSKILKKSQRVILHVPVFT